MPIKYPQRKQIRLKEYDYSSQGYYFITICTHKRKELFGKINGSVKTAPYILLNTYGKIANNELQQISKHFNNVEIGEYIIMPNHIHFILRINNYKDIIEDKNVGACLDKPVKISTIIGLYKSGVTRKINKYKDKKETIWQRNYYEHIIRNDKEYYKIVEYINTNIIKWEDDKYFNNI